MKRYLLFGGNNYYPSGGAEDFINDFDSIEETNQCIIQRSSEEKEFFTECDIWYNILDTENRILIKEQRNCKLNCFGDSHKQFFIDQEIETTTLQNE